MVIEAASRSKIHHEQKHDSSSQAPSCSFDHYADRSYMRYTFYKDGKRIVCSYAANSQDSVGTLQTVTVDSKFYNLTTHQDQRDALATQFGIGAKINMSATEWFIKNNKIPHETHGSNNLNKEFIALNKKDTDPMPMVWGEADTVSIFTAKGKEPIEFANIPTAPSKPEPIVFETPTAPVTYSEPITKVWRYPETPKPDEPSFKDKLKNKFQSLKESWTKRLQKPNQKIYDPKLYEVIAHTPSNDIEVIKDERGTYVVATTEGRKNMSVTCVYTQDADTNEAVMTSFAITRKNKQPYKYDPSNSEERLQHAFKQLNIAFPNSRINRIGGNNLQQYINQIVCGASELPCKIKDIEDLIKSINGNNK